MKPLLSETHAKPTPNGLAESKALTIDVLGVHLEPGDEVFWTIRGSASSINSRWINLRERFSVVRSRVGTSYCSPGAPNSLDATSRLSGVGSRRPSDDDLTLVAFDVSFSSFGYFLASRSQGFVVQPGGSDRDGVLVDVETDVCGDLRHGPASCGSAPRFGDVKPWCNPRALKPGPSMLSEPVVFTA
ncbi:MAG: hypothetical protein AAF957_26010 [Planctomycetota bacterium]